MVISHRAAGLLVSAASTVTPRVQELDFGSLLGLRKMEKQQFWGGRVGVIVAQVGTNPPLKVTGRRPSTHRQNRMRGTASDRVVLPLTCSPVAQETHRATCRRDPVTFPIT